MYPGGGDVLHAGTWTGRMSVRASDNTISLFGRMLFGAVLVGLPIAATDGPAAADPPDPVSELVAFVDVPAGVMEIARRSADASPVDDTVLNVHPVEFRAVGLNRTSMESLLVRAAPGSPVRVDLPAPDGTTATFDIEPNGVMAPELAAAFPRIRTFGGRGITDPSATVALDLGPHGFHAQVLSPHGNWYIDPAVHRADDLHLSYLRSESRERPGEFVERPIPDLDGLRDEASDATGPSAAPPTSGRAGSQLRTHRIAVTADQGYADFHSSDTDPVATRIESVQAEIVTVVNRVSAIYQQEIAVRLQLVAGNDELTFLDDSGSCTGTAEPIASISDGIVTTSAPHGLSDGVVVIAGTTTSSLDGKWTIEVTGASTFRLVTGSSSGTSTGGSYAPWDFGGSDDGDPICSPFNSPLRPDELTLNQIVVDRIIGSADYDVGHVVTTAGGGVAYLGVVGVDGWKAGGTTGLNTPTGDSFYVDYVAHELGHQYGGDHTFNGTRGACGGYKGPVAFEPGSGSTIQAYAGICSLDDLQRVGDATGSSGASDPYLHSGSFDQITEHLSSGAGSTAGSTSDSGNAVPTVDAGDDIVIPAQTPFFLNADASDPDGDTLRFHHEQRDLGQARPLDDPEITDGPLFRSFPATTDRRSTFPRIADVRVGNTNQASGTCPPPDGTRVRALCWAQFLVPTAGPVAVGADRDLSFRATVRDGAGTFASAGGIDTDDVAVTVHNTGTPFRLSTPNGGRSYPAGGVPVRWDVAGTAAAPIGVEEVSLRLSTDGGRTFPTEIVGATPNDGVAVVSLPNQARSGLRVMVHSGDYDDGNGFFDISDADFSVTVDRPGVRVVPSESQADPASGGVVNFTVIFNEAVTGFASDDVVLGGTAGATTATVTGSGTTYEVAVTGMTDSGTVVVSVRANAAVGAHGSNTASSDVDGDNTITYDARPRVAVDQADAQADPATSSPIRFDAVFSRAVTGFDGSDVVLGGTAGATTAVVTGSGTTYEIAVSGMQRDGTVTASVPAGVASAGSYPNVASTAADDTVTYVAPTPEIVSLVPARVFASRADDRTIDGRFENTGRIGTDGSVEIVIAGRGGVSPSGAAAVMNVTAINPSGRGYITTYPCGERPLASSLNYSAAGAVIGNELVAKLSPSGTVCVFSSTETDLTIDVVGYVPGSSGIVSLDPARVYATRAGDQTVDRQQEAVGQIREDTFVEVPIVGRGGVSPAGVDSVVMNITAVNPLRRGFVTTYPCGNRPLASSLNYDSAGLVVGNELIAKLSPSGTVCVFSSATTDLTIDVVGFVPTTSPATSLDPARVYATRPDDDTIDDQQEGVGRILANGSTEVVIAGRAGVPVNGAGAVVMNITAINPSGRGYVTTYPCGARPLASSLNYSAAGAISGNELVAKLGPSGTVCIFTSAETDLTVDVVGFVPA